METLKYVASRVQVTSVGFYDVSRAVVSLNRYDENGHYMGRKACGGGRKIVIQVGPNWIHDRGGWVRGYDDQYEQAKMLADRLNAELSAPVAVGGVA